MLRRYRLHGFRGQSFAGSVHHTLVERRVTGLVTRRVTRLVKPVSTIRGLREGVDAGLRWGARMLR
jgi:hypothetical protein